MMEHMPALQVEMAAQPAPAARKAPLDLFRALEESGVRYCLWKSNIRLQQGLRGETDLDVLVDPEDARLFKRILSAHSVRYVCAAPGRGYPSIENYLGFDDATGGLFHLH